MMRVAFVFLWNIFLAMAFKTTKDKPAFLEDKQYAPLSVEDKQHDPDLVEDELSNKVIQIE